MIGRSQAQFPPVQSQVDVPLMVMVMRLHLCAQQLVKIWNPDDSAGQFVVELLLNVINTH